MLARTASLIFTFIITLLLIVFCVDNRKMVEVSFFPLPYLADLPQFLLLLAIFALGALVAWLLGISSTWKQKRNLAAEKKRVMALENEVKMLHAERAIASSSPPRLV